MRHPECRGRKSPRNLRPSPLDQKGQGAEPGAKRPRELILQTICHCLQRQVVELEVTCQSARHAVQQRLSANLCLLPGCVAQAHDGQARASAKHDGNSQAGGNQEARRADAIAFLVYSRHCTSV